MAKKKTKPENTGASQLFGIKQSEVEKAGTLIINTLKRNKVGVHTGAFAMNCLLESLGKSHPQVAVMNLVLR